MIHQKSKIHVEKGGDLQPRAKIFLNLKKIAGIDEVGRGCLFGPVIASAVVLNKSTGKTLIKAGLKDSKKLTKVKIQELAPLIKEMASAWGLGQASAREIDTFGIRLATERAMIRALHRLSEKPNLLLVDGVLPIRQWDGSQKTIPQGDNCEPSIAAASVIAKEYRDKLIMRIANEFPQYGLKKHVGYGTLFHRKAIKSFGPTRLHRLSFLKKIL